MAAWHLARARPHGGAPGPARAGAYRVGDLAAVVFTFSDRAARWPPAMVAEDFIAAVAASGAGGLERLSDIALFGITSVNDDDPALPFSGDPAGFVADPLRAAGLLVTGDGECADATIVLDAALLRAFLLVARCDVVVSYAAPPDDETSVVVAAEPPLDFAGIVDTSECTDLHVAASNFLTGPVLAQLALAPCRRIVFHGSPPGAVPPGLRHLPTGLVLSTLVWEVICGMAASSDFPACVLDDSAPAPTTAGLAKLVCGAKRITRCPLGQGGDGDEACCAECAGNQVNYVDAFTARAASGRDLPACATAGWDDGMLSRAAQARDTWLRLAAPLA